MDENRRTGAACLSVSFGALFSPGIGSERNVSPRPYSCEHEPTRQSRFESSDPASNASDGESSGPFHRGSFLLRHLRSAMSGIPHTAHRAPFVRGTDSWIVGELPTIFTTGSMCPARYSRTSLTLPNFRSEPRSDGQPARVPGVSGATESPRQCVSLRNFDSAIRPAVSRNCEGWRLHEVLPQGEILFPSSACNRLVDFFQPRSK